MERWHVHNRAEPGNCTCGPDDGNVCHKLLQSFLFITPAGIMPGVLYSLGTNLEISATLKSSKKAMYLFFYNFGSVLKGYCLEMLLHSKYFPYRSSDLKYKT